MEIEGRIILDLPLQQGTSKAGNPWKKKEWVLETFGAYPKKIMFGAFGDRIDSLQIEAGKEYTVSVDIESREFNGRWYTDIRAYAARPYQGQQMQGPESEYPQPPVSEPGGGYMGGVGSTFPPQPAAPAFTQTPNDSEDLPF